MSKVTSKKMENIRAKLMKANDELQDIFAEREDVIHGFFAGVLASKHVLLLGPPGTAKSFLARSVFETFADALTYEILLTRFTSPEEIFGPTSMKGLKEDKFVRVLDGYLAASHFGIIDEIYKGSSAILNSLLTIANERKFHNGGIPVMTPVQTLVGASNELPEEGDGLEALDDRLQLRFLVQQISAREDMKKMLRSEALPKRTTLSMKELEEAKKDVVNVNISDDIMNVYLDLWSLCRSKGFNVTDRVFKQSLDILKASAWLNGRDSVTEDDFEILRHVYWKAPEERRPVHLEILNATNPMKSKITEIFQDAESIVKDALTAHNEAKKNGKAGNHDSGMELVGKLKEKVEEVDSRIKEMQSVNKDTKDVRRMHNRMVDMMDEVAEKLLGFNLSALAKKKKNLKSKAW